MKSRTRTAWVFVFAFTWWGAVGGAGLWVMAWAEGTALPFFKLVGAGVGLAWLALTLLYMEDKKRRRGERSKEAAQVIPINRARRRKC
jgi:hypothetical protein